MQLDGAAVKERLAVGKHEQSLAVAVGLGKVVSCKQDRGPAARQIEHELPEPLALAGIESGRGLIEQQHGRFGQQPDRDVDPLLVAPREAPDLLATAGLQPGLEDHPLNGCFGVRDPLEAGEEAQVLLHREASIERRLLGNPADPFCLHGKLARIGVLDSREDREQRGLAGPVGPDHGDQLTASGGNRDTAQGILLPETLAQPARLDYGTGTRARALYHQRLLSGLGGPC